MRWRLKPKPERWDYTGLGDYLKYKWRTWFLSAWGVGWSLAFLVLFHSILSTWAIWFLVIMIPLNTLTFLGVCRTYYKVVVPHMAWREEIMTEWSQKALDLEKQAELIQWSDSVSADQLRALSKLARQLSRLEHLEES